MPVPVIEIVATEIGGMEPCYWLEERIIQSPGSKGFHRYQQIGVMRFDRVAWFREDLGPVKAIKADEFSIPGGWMNDVTGKFDILHTVEELRDMADWMRSMKPESRQIEPRDLVGGYERVMEKRREHAKRNKKR